MLIVRMMLTGTRAGMTEAQKKRVSELVEIHKPDVAIHGDCIGADADFNRIIRDLDREVLIQMHPAKGAGIQRAWCDKRPKQEITTVYQPDLPLVRNRTMVDKASLVIATPKEYSMILRSGTWAAVRYAEKIKKPLIVVYPDGGVISSAVVPGCWQKPHFIESQHRNIYAK